MAMMQATMDGSRIKALVEDEEQFSVYVDKRFDALDADHNGTVTPAQLKPAVQSLGAALGLPPMGTSKETDHIYDEVYEQFMDGNRTTRVEKKKFGKVLKDILLGLADGLERDPITVMKLDGGELRKYATSERLEVDIISIFTRFDVRQEGRIPADRVIDVLPTISVRKGMPPAGDPKVQKLIEKAMLDARINVGESLDQMQFVEMVRKLLVILADVLKQNPLNVAHSEKEYDGQSIKKLLKNHEELQKILEENWMQLPKDHHNKVSKDYLRASLDNVGPAAGLPPLGCADEVDEVLVEIFNKSDFDNGERVNKEKFQKCIKQILGSVMLHLEGKPVTIKSSKVVGLDGENPQ
ncbi:hypothetical protein R1flu_017462 [Riccia fluitans]|uniref:EF-hand domain-containing protein n=1 Tax=Riccia fluitans TaxID=41844 RepID=A0ABD1ZD16_9MARC